MVEAPHQEDRQRDKGGTARPRDQVGRGRKLADVELEVAHHPPERSDDRHDLDEVGIDSVDGDAAVLERSSMTGRGNRDLESRSSAPLPKFVIHRSNLRHELSEAKGH